MGVITQGRKQLYITLHIEEGGEFHELVLHRELFSIRLYNFGFILHRGCVPYELGCALAEALPCRVWLKSLHACTAARCVLPVCVLV